MISDVALKAEVLTKFQFETDTKSRRKTSPCRVMLDGRYIRTRSGKTVWSQAGHAKNALRNELNSILCEHFWKCSSYEQRSNLEHTLIKELLASGRMVIVPVNPLEI